MKHDIRTLDATKVLVSPSLLAADFWNLEREINAVADAGADMLHLDVMDGHMVPNISFGVPVIKALRNRTELLFDTHLMISHPAAYAAAFAAAGSDHITFHMHAGCCSIQPAQHRPSDKAEYRNQDPAHGDREQI